MSAIDELADELGAIMANNKMMIAYSRPGKGELFILRYLAERDSPALPSELSEALQSSTARISAVLRSLEKKEQVRRKVDPLNRRNVLVTITDAGRDRVRGLLEHMRHHLRYVLTQMGEQDAREYVRLLKRFVEIARCQMPEPDFPDMECPAGTMKP